MSTIRVPAYLLVVEVEDNNGKLITKGTEITQEESDELSEAICAFSETNGSWDQQAYFDYIAKGIMTPEQIKTIEKYLITEGVDTIEAIKSFKTYEIMSTSNLYTRL